MTNVQFNPGSEDEPNREKAEDSSDSEKELVNRSSETLNGPSFSSKEMVAAVSPIMDGVDIDTMSMEDSNQCLEEKDEKPFRRPCSLPEDKPIVPKKGYDLSFLDKFENLENATPSFSQAKFPVPFPIETSQTPCLETSTAEQSKEVAGMISHGETTLEIESTSVLNSTFAAVSVADKTTELLKTEDTSCYNSDERQVSGEGLAAVPSDVATAPFPIVEPAYTTAVEVKSESATEDIKSDSSSTENQHTAYQEPTQHRLQRSATAAAKINAFEIEFKFDPNDDPFKSKARLCSSPRKGDMHTSVFAPSPFEENFPSLEANSTINVTDVSNEANNTVIDTMAEPQKEGNIVLSNEPSDNALAIHGRAIEDEIFRPAQEVFRDPSDLDYLMQHGGTSQDIALARQSLFLKFDPLIGGRPSLFSSRQSNGVSGADETIVVEEQSGGRKSTGESLFLFSPPHASGVSGTKTEKKQIASAVDCFSSLTPVIADDVIGLHEHREALQRQELLFQDKLLQKDREITTKEKQNKELKAELEAALVAKTQINQTLVDYEKTISQLIADKEREKANLEMTIQNTIKERDQAIEDLKEVERAFGEFHRMYERNRTAAERLQKNEQALKKSLDVYKERVQQEQQKFETLKLRSAEKLEKALQEMELMKGALEAESTQLKAQLKKTEMRLASAEASIEQKSKENQELTKLCDELINKMGCAK